ncbi:MAG: acetolactate synthase small subunit [Nitrospinae bacterium]|nr:acetolactate synthase small subunit [Nitrospinota bacterium]
MAAKHRHTISVLVENKFGVLSRIAGLFSGRGFNIESLSVAPTLDATTSRMTIITVGDDKIVEQITKQLNKLIDVIKVIDFTGDDHDHVEREIVLVKINAEPSNRAEILRMVEIFRGKVVDVSPKTYMIEVTGAEGKLNAFVEMIRPLGILEVARSGKVAMSRGKKSLT